MLAGLKILTSPSETKFSSSWHIILQSFTVIFYLVKYTDRVVQNTVFLHSFLTR
jgi:hypothetical protein